MNCIAFCSRATYVLAVLAACTVSANAQVALRRPLSPDTPLIVPGVILTNISGISSQWNSIPANLRPYCALNADPEWNQPTEAQVDAFIAECQRLGIPCILQAEAAGRPSYFDQDGSIGDRLMKKYPNFLGYQWCEFADAPMNVPYNPITNNMMIAHLRVMAANGGYLMLASMTGGLFNAIGQTAALMNAFKANSANLVIMDKMTNGSNYYWNNAATWGLWLSGFCGNWGVSADCWIWDCSFWATCQGTANNAPAAIQGMEIEKSACLGATVYLKFETFNSTRLNQIVYPLLQKIVQIKAIPTLSEAKSRIKVGHKYAGAMNEPALFGGLYSDGGFWMPRSGRYYSIPVFPALSSGADISFCQPVGLYQFKSLADKKAFYDPLYPDNGITGNSWVEPFPDKGVSYFANPNDTKDATITTTFTLPLLRNSCASLSGTLPSFTYGTVQETPTYVDILVGNVYGSQTRTTTFVLKGLAESAEPVLTISGQTSYTKNWNATTQEYTLSVTHNSTVSIRLVTSGVAKPPTLGLSARTVSAAVLKDAASPSPQTVKVLNAGSGTLGDVTSPIAFSGQAGWLTVQKTGSGNNQVLTNTFATQGLAPGNYSATVTVSAANPAQGLTCVVNLSIISLRQPENPATAFPGLSYSCYNGTWSKLPAFESLTPVKSGITSSFNIQSAGLSVNYGMKFTGYIDVPEDGEYAFYLQSDDGSNLWIGTTLVVNHDGGQAMNGNAQATNEASGVIGLKKGRHAITVGYFQGSGQQGLIVSWAGPSFTKTTIPASVLTNSIGPVACIRHIAAGIAGARIQSAGNSLLLIAPDQCNVRVFDITGRTVFHHTFAGRPAKAVRSGQLPAGMYTVRIQFASGETLSQRVMVR